MSKFIGVVLAATLAFAGAAGANFTTCLNKWVIGGVHISYFWLHFQYV